MNKGKNREEVFASILEYCGYETYIPPKAKYREQDVFGEYDILAFDDELIGVQVRSRASGVTDWFERTSRFELSFRSLYAVYFDDEDGECAAWKVAERDDEGYVWAVDERNVDCDAGEAVAKHLDPEVPVA